MRLLLIEDDKKIALFVKTGLKEAGFAVDHAANGQDGLHLALTEPYDIAVIDLMLPEVDGLEVCKILRRDPKTSGIPTDKTCTRTMKKGVTIIRMQMASRILIRKSVKVRVDRVCILR